MTLYQSLAGKYFINTIQAVVNAKALTRGRIIGPISNEYSPFYLAEIYPSDDTTIAVTTQTIMQIEQLVGVYLYESRPMLDAAWDAAIRRATAQLKEQQKQRQQAMRMIEKRLIKTLKAQGIDVVDASLVQHAAAETVIVMAAAEAGAEGVAAMLGGDGGDD